MGLSNFLSRCGLAAVVLLGTAGSVAAGEFSYELPQIEKSYLGDSYAMPPVDVTVDLGTEFTEILGASLQLSGTLDLGRYGDLNFPGEFPLGAEIYGSFSGMDIFSSVRINGMLTSDGAFTLEQHFDVGRFADGPPDFSPWLDGTAEFSFGVGTPARIATTYLIEMPSLTIDSAALVVSGQPSLDEFMVGADFDGSGSVDDGDLVLWERDFGAGGVADADGDGDIDGGDFLAWQRQRGHASFTGGVAAVVPEPSALVLGAVAAGFMAPIFRRR